MDEPTFNTSNIDCWVSLAAAICSTGIKEHDTLFLESDWCKELTEAVVEWDKIKYSGRRIH